MGHRFSNRVHIHATGLAMPNILSLLLSSNPLSISQYGRELHLAWKGCNDDAAFHYEIQASNPWSRILKYFPALTFPSQTTNSELPAVQMASQTITKKPPNLTVGCRCRKENSWGGSARPGFDCWQESVQTGTHRRRQRYPKTPEACLSSLIPIAFCAQWWKGKEVAPF